MAGGKLKVDDLVCVRAVLEGGRGRVRKHGNIKAGGKTLGLVLKTQIPRHDSTLANSRT